MLGSLQICIKLLINRCIYIWNYIFIYGKVFSEEFTTKTTKFFLYFYIFLISSRATTERDQHIELILRQPYEMKVSITNIQNTARMVNVRYK